MSAVSNVTVVRNSGVVMIKIPPSYLCIELDIEGASGSRPEVALDVVERYRPQALVCGPMFEKNDGQTDYRNYNSARLLYRYLDVRNNINVISRYPTRGSTISVVGNQAFHYRGDRIEAGATFAIQGYPSMIENSENKSSTVKDTNSTGRACVGIHQDGSVIFATYTGGIRQFSELLIGIGVKAATYMDGGGSTSMFGPDVTIGLRSRRLPSYVMAIPPNQSIQPNPTPIDTQPSISNTGPFTPQTQTPAPFPQGEVSSPPIPNHVIVPQREDIPVEQDVEDSEGERPDETHEEHSREGYYGIAKGVVSRNPVAFSIPALILAGAIGFLTYKYIIKPKYIKDTTKKDENVKTNT
jgi:hypothetical protein